MNGNDKEFFVAKKNVESEVRDIYVYYAIKDYLTIHMEKWPAIPSKRPYKTELPDDLRSLKEKIDKELYPEKTSSEQISRLYSDLISIEMIKESLKSFLEKNYSENYFSNEADIIRKTMSKAQAGFFKREYVNRAVSDLIASRTLLEITAESPEGQSYYEKTLFSYHQPSSGYGWL